MRVNIADIKSKWFGESEKQIKNLFGRYRACVDEYRKENAPVPVLLFNEADAVISKRRTLHETRTGPDQTENALQNILLEEIENLSGIIIATTNLTKNMDSAFERRFIYKIEFNLPEKETRAKIWKSQISSISEADAEVLAERYCFSGGQIENISRKFIVDLVLDGVDADLKRMIQYCDDEMIEKEAKPLGFTA
jgi:SpoVK/Ycf46/Vps4 family AAA+-type ATPase